MPLGSRRGPSLRIHDWRCRSEHERQLVEPPFEFPGTPRESPIAKLADAIPFRWPSEDAPWLAVQEQPPSDAGLIMHVEHGPHLSCEGKTKKGRAAFAVQPTVCGRCGRLRTVALAAGIEHSVRLRGESPPRWIIHLAGARLMMELGPTKRTGLANDVRKAFGHFGL